MHAALPAGYSESDEAVERFLRASPGWLAAHPDLYLALTPPVRVYGEPLADHMAAMVVRARRHASSLAERNAAILTASRAAATMLGRVQEAVLCLIAADDAMDCILGDIPRIMAMDAAALSHRGGESSVDRQESRLDAVLGAEDVVSRTSPADAACLYAEAAPLARHDILIRLPQIGVFGLASRHANEGDFRLARAPLKFLGCAIAAAIGRKSNWRSRQE